MTMRVAAIQAVRRLINFHVASPDEVLRKVEDNLDALVQLVDRAGEEGCDAVALPEDTMGLLHWEAGNEERLGAVLPRAVPHMLERLGEAAARHRMYLVCCSDAIEGGHMYNTAFLLGRDGRQIGRYHKVNMPYSELGQRRRGTCFPVFDTPDLGSVGMLICYDMVFPEAIRCLALGGADIVFVPTMGGAAMGDGDISRAAFRTRAADNFVYLVVAHTGSGSMVLSPAGKVLAAGERGEAIIAADIDPFGGRESGNAFDWQRDVRTRLFRERAPEAYGMLTDPEPPALGKLPTGDTPEVITRRCNRVLTVGEEEFREANELFKGDKKDKAILAFERLCTAYPNTWIDRVSRERLESLKKESR